MSDKIFLRANSWYRAPEKEISTDIEVSELIDNVSAQYPEIEIDSSAGASLPSQTGNSGKFLKTDGSAASWANAGGGGGVTIYGPYASNAAALADNRSIGDIYQTTSVGPDLIQPLLSVVVAAP